MKKTKGIYANKGRNNPTSSKTRSKTFVRQYQRHQKPISAKNTNCDNPKQSTPNINKRHPWGTKPTNTINSLTIIQYNCGYLNYKATCPLFNNLNPKKHQIIILQKPTYNKQTRKTYQPKGYYFLYKPDLITCICFFS